MNGTKHNLKMFLWMTLLTGLIYPLVITGIAYLCVSEKASGSLIRVKGQVVGSALIGQRFTSDKYFWGRPSATDYKTLPSGASNWGPTSAALKKAVEERKVALLKAHSIEDRDVVPPSQLLFASGSGLDPHITPVGVNFQIKRVIKARGWDPEKAQPAIEKLILELTEREPIPFLSEASCVNVLQLNLALDVLDLK